MERINTHNHTTYCGHADNTMADMVRAASEKGIDIFAITEHYPLIEPFDSWGYISLPYYKLDDYLAEIHALRRAYPEMTILSGVEVDWLGDLENRPLDREDWSRFDMVLGSVHFLDGWAFDDPAEAETWKTKGVDECWRRYFEIWCQAADARTPFTIMSHPDLIKKFGFRPSFDLLPFYREAAEVCASAGKMIEVNTSGRFYACKEFFPALDMLAEFCKAGVPCTIGTDAHACVNVDRAIDEACRYLYEAGYRCVTVPTIGGGRREIPIV